MSDAVALVNIKANLSFSEDQEIIMARKGDQLKVIQDMGNGNYLVVLTNDPEAVNFYATAGQIVLK